MSWELATAGEHVCRAILVEMEVESGALRMHDGVGHLSWDGNDWLGVGDLGSISGISGGLSVEAGDLTLTMAGIPSDYRDEVLQEVQRGKRVTVYMGIVDKASGTWAHEPEAVYTGFVNVPSVEEEAGEGGAFLTVTIKVISAGSYVRRLQVWRRTDADQKSRFSGDRFYEFKTDMRIPIATKQNSSSILGRIRGSTPPKPSGLL
jgi:hypothetical protein